MPMSLPWKEMVLPNFSQGENISLESRRFGIESFHVLDDDFSYQSLRIPNLPPAGSAIKHLNIEATTDQNHLPSFIFLQCWGKL